MARRPNSNGETPQFSPTHMVQLIRDAIPPIHPAGLPFVLLPAAVAVLAGFTKHRSLCRLSLAATVTCAAFFRVPTRATPPLPEAITSPADGEVCIIDEAVPPAELGLGEQPRPRVTVFLSVLDVHVQRAPIRGRVTQIVHKAGKFLSADVPDASRVNERTSMVQQTDNGDEVITVQIAGLIARRIKNDAQVGDNLERGLTYGLIRFGSRVDTYLPAGSTPLVWVGQRAIGGETILATLSPPRSPASKTAESETATSRTENGGLGAQNIVDPHSTKENSA